MAKFLIIYLLFGCCVKNSLVVANVSENVPFWTTIVQGCNGKLTMECIRTNIFNYMKKVLEHNSDVQFTSFMKFARNENNYTEPNQFNGDQNVTMENGYSLEEASRSLHDTTIKFLMTHDLELELPDYFFEGTILKFSPRSLEQNGALVKFEFVPNERRDLDDVGEGRIFFKKIKNLSKCS